MQGPLPYELPSFRDSGNDFSFPVPFPFLKINDIDKKSFLFGYPKNKSRFFSFPVNPKRNVFYAQNTWVSALV